MSWPYSEAELCTLVIREAAHAIIVADREGVIRLWNRGAEELFAYSAEEALGQSLNLIIPERHRQAHWEGYYRAMAKGQTKYARGQLLSVPALRRDGSRISVEFTVALLKDVNGEVQGIAAVMADVTERWQREKALREQLAQLERRLGETM